MNKQNKYVLVYWPEIQDFMDHPRYKECYMCNSLDENEDIVVSTYMVPDDLYDEVMKRYGNSIEKLKELENND